MNQACFLFISGLPVLVVAVTASISRHQYLRDDLWVNKCSYSCTVLNLNLILYLFYELITAWQSMTKHKCDVVERSTDWKDHRSFATPASFSIWPFHASGFMKYRILLCVTLSLELLTGWHSMPFFQISHDDNLLSSNSIWHLLVNENTFCQREKIPFYCWQKSF